MGHQRDVVIIDFLCGLGHLRAALPPARFFRVITPVFIVDYEDILKNEC
jgi:hypothetical protein